MSCQSCMVGGRLRQTGAGKIKDNTKLLKKYTIKDLKKLFRKYKFKYDNKNGRAENLALFSMKVSNSTDKVREWVKKNNPVSKEETLFILEHTGIYSEQIALFFDENNISFALIPGLEIKKSLGISRGKDDKVDATKIALYGYRLRDEIKPYKLPSESINQLKRLLTLRERLVKQRAGHKSTLKEQNEFTLKKTINFFLKLMIE